MFVGRERELAALGRMYDRPGFQMAVIYGRRRVGKTTLIDEFVRDKRVLYFTAQQKTPLQNLTLFAQTACRTYDLPYLSGSFRSWNEALEFVIGQERDSAHDAPLIFVFDEFPYAAESDPSLPSILQIAIDHGFKETDVRLILCGSNEGFMESDVLGSKSPLYGRRTMQLRVRPFDYLDAAQMLPGLDPQKLVTYYVTFGGTPYYLSQIDLGVSYEDNVRGLMFSTSGMLYEEPLMLLRQELREPSRYNSVLDAVGRGYGTPSRIAEHSGINQNSVGKYLRTLSQLGIVSREAPFGEKMATSRNARYRMADPFFSFWYRFVSSSVSSIEEGAGDAVARYVTSGQALNTYVGEQFERVCLQWLVRENAKGRLPFTALEFGRWWGTDPVAKERVDIDVIAGNTVDKALLVGECKWRNSFDETKAIATLGHRATLLGGFLERDLFLFTKLPVSAGTAEKVSSRRDLRTVCVDELYCL